jgi:hypothetical protein
MLKVVLAPDVSRAVDVYRARRELTWMSQEPPEGFVQNYCLLIGDRAFTNFQKVSQSRHSSPDLLARTAV